MRKLFLINALVALLTSVLFLDKADAQVIGPDPYAGHASSHCEAPTHASYYDPRNEGQTIYNSHEGAGNSRYYVDTTPLAGFDPDGDYATTQTPSQDCKGTPVATVTAHFAVTLSTSDGTTNVGFPLCSPDGSPNARNPNCEDFPTGVQGAFFVGIGDGSQGVGFSGGATLP